MKLADPDRTLQKSVGIRVNAFRQDVNAFVLKPSSTRPSSRAAPFRTRFDAPSSFGGIGTVLEMTLIWQLYKSATCDTPVILAGHF